MPNAYTDTGGGRLGWSAEATGPFLLHRRSSSPAQPPQHACSTPPSAALRLPQPVFSGFSDDEDDPQTGVGSRLRGTRCRPEAAAAASVALVAALAAHAAADVAAAAAAARAEEERQEQGSVARDDRSLRSSPSPPLAQQQQQQQQQQQDEEEERPLQTPAELEEERRQFGAALAAIEDRMLSCEAVAARGGDAGDVTDYAGVRPVVRAAAAVAEYSAQQRALQERLLAEAALLRGIGGAAEGILDERRSETRRADRLYGSAADIVRALRARAGAANRPPSPSPPPLPPPPSCYRARLDEQKTELDTLGRSHAAYRRFMADCFEIQAMMFEADCGEDSDAESEEDGGGDAGFAVRDVLPSEAALRLRYDRVTARVYKKLRRRLNGRLRTSRQVEDAMLVELAGVVGLQRTAAVAAADPHAPRDKLAEPWVQLGRLPKAACGGEEACADWLEAAAKTPRPSCVFVNKQDPTALVFFPTVASHARAARVLRAFAIREAVTARGVYPCRRCYAAVACVACEECDVWMCRFCLRFLHEAKGLVGHAVVDRPQP